MDPIKHIPTIAIAICVIVATSGCKPIEAPRTTSALASNAELTMLYEDKETTIFRMESDLETCVIYERATRGIGSIACRWKEPAR